MFKTPILFLIFNRPDTTIQVFEAIKQIRPAFLFIAADGPRKNRSGEFEKCQETRDFVINAIDWDCEVKTLFRDENLGCGKAVSSAITWFFENVEEGIILEDDCLPNSDFFQYCTELLDYYRNDPRIMHISGNSLRKKANMNKGSYYFSAHSHIWGWASWRSVWNKYSFTLDNIDEPSFKRLASDYLTLKGDQEYWTKIFLKMKRLEIDTWDYQLTFSIWKSGGLSIIPNVNLVTNLGFGIEATHTKKENELANMPSLKILPLRHPQQIKIDRKADQSFYRNYINKNIFKKVVSKLKRTYKSFA